MPQRGFAVNVHAGMSGIAEQSCMHVCTRSCVFECLRYCSFACSAGLYVAVQLQLLLLWMPWTGVICNGELSRCFFGVLLVGSYIVEMYSCGVAGV